MAKESKTTGGTDAFLDSLQKKLMSQSDLISSDSTKLEKAIGSAMTKVQESGAATRRGTEASFTRQVGEAKELGAEALNTTMESQRGYAVNTGLIRNIQETTDKQVKDLELRKAEALAMGDAATASTLAQLQIQGLQFRQQAQQQVFSNLLSTAGFLAQRSEAEKAAHRADRTQTFQEKSAMSNIALQYGLTLQPGDTIDSVTTRAMPFASEKQKVELDQARASIANLNAQTQKALADARASNTVASGTDIESMALASLSNPAVLSVIKNPETVSKVINRANQLRQEQIKSAVTEDKSSGLTKSQAIADVKNNKDLSLGEQADMIKAIESVYGADSAQPKAPPANFWDMKASAEKGLQDFGRGLGQFFSF